jgi:hypothetical protein
MAVVREVALELKEEALPSGQPSRLRLSIRDDAGVYDLRGEDEAGNLRFGYRDHRAFCVVQEFDRTLAELREDYRIAEDASAAHG